MVGETTFRRLIDGLQLIEEYSVEGKVLILADAILTSAELSLIGSNAPTPVLVRDVSTLNCLKDVTYLVKRSGSLKSSLLLEMP